MNIIYNFLQKQHSDIIPDYIVEPVEFFLLFFDDEYLQKVAYQNNLYANYSGAEGFSLNVAELKCFWVLIY